MNYHFDLETEKAKIKRSFGLKKYKQLNEKRICSNTGRAKEKQVKCRRLDNKSIVAPVSNKENTKEE